MPRGGERGREPGLALRELFPFPPQGSAPPEGREEEAGQGDMPLHSNGGQCRSSGYYCPGLNVVLKGGDGRLITRGT